ncbi:hypothetical protein [uncultured Olegusella sp.]|uniref:hypothetical protein n=1 Tax=uncultured Olegusella sp. TaxID=1979846 RepID=UPI002628B515|nr:hypothetical protein [uncultured Olegusella sp.]
MTDEKEREVAGIQLETAATEPMSKHAISSVAQSASRVIASSFQEQHSCYLRAENEDDDGYDPFSDRPAEPEPLFQSDPWR